MSQELEALREAWRQALEAEEPQEARARISKVIGLAGVALAAPNPPTEAHEIAGLAWVHHPVDSPFRAERARHHLGEVLKATPEHAVVRLLLGRLILAQGNRIEALVLLSSLDPARFVEAGRPELALKLRELVMVCHLETAPVKVEVPTFEAWVGDCRAASPQAAVEPLEMTRALSGLCQHGRLPRRLSGLPGALLGLIEALGPTPALEPFLGPLREAAAGS